MEDVPFRYSHVAHKSWLVCGWIGDRFLASCRGRVGDSLLFFGRNSICTHHCELPHGQEIRSLAESTPSAPQIKVFSWQHFDFLFERWRQVVWNEFLVSQRTQVLITLKDSGQTEGSNKTGDHCKVPAKLKTHAHTHTCIMYKYIYIDIIWTNSGTHCKEWKKYHGQLFRDLWLKTHDHPRDRWNSIWKAQWPCSWNIPTLCVGD